MLPAFSLARPATLAEAISLLDSDAVPYCGGTELLLAMRTGLLRPRTLVDIKRVPQLAGIEVVSGHLLIGAIVTHRQLARHPLVAEHAPFLAGVERGVGNPRVRAQGSVGGNLCFGDPRSDLLTVLIALRATMVIQGAGTPREIAAEDFLTGPYETARQDGELLQRVAVPLPFPPVTVYRKYRTAERPTVTVAMVGDSTSARVVVGAAGEVPVHRDSHPGEVGEPALVTALDPVADLAGSDRYKRAMAEVHLRRVVAAYQEEVARREEAADIG